MFCFAKRDHSTCVVVVTAHVCSSIEIRPTSVATTVASVVVLVVVVVVGGGVAEALQK